MAFVVPQPIGLILAIVAMNKAKKENRSTTLSKISLVVNLITLVIAILVVTVVFGVIPHLQNNQAIEATMVFNKFAVST